MTTTRVHKSDCDVYIGRGDGGEFHFGKAVNESRLGEKGWLGNHYSESDWDRETSIELFERDLGWAVEADPAVKWALFSLYGKRLGCYCRPDQDCHGDALVRAVNNLYWSNL